MRRSVLVTLVVLGSLISLIGGTGLFAALTDSARSGTNSVDTAGLAASADIQLAAATQTESTGAVTCGTFAEELTTAFITVDDIETDATGHQAYYCIRNVGSQAVSLSALTDSLTDVDTACTGDEALFDTTCGGGLAGEVAETVVVGYSAADCSTGFAPGYTPISLEANLATARDLGSLAAGSTGCFWLIVYWGTTDAAAIQAGQSDTATWRFKFVGDAS